MPHNGKNFGKVEVIGDRIPESCGYQKRFKYNIDMNSNGIGGECIEWCEENCQYKWGWWFEAPDNPEVFYNHWEGQKAWMSFANRKEAMTFWISVGIQNYGQKD
jgi:hypothetical protein|tara:strand:+ start:245 stop:556 length:312 start_codon:yes stop_codon:yes gene_type:complete